MKSVITFIVLFVIGELCFAESLQSLNNQDLNTLVKDKTLTIFSLMRLADQNPNNALAVYFDRQGKAIGQFTKKPDKFPQNDQGIWTAKENGTLCITWQHWGQSKPLCLYAYKQHNGILFVNSETNNFESLTYIQNIFAGNHLK